MRIRKWKWLGDYSLDAIERHNIFVWIRYDFFSKKYI